MVTSNCCRALPFEAKFTQFCDTKLEDLEGICVKFYGNRPNRLGGDRSARKTSIHPNILTEYPPYTTLRAGIISYRMCVGREDHTFPVVWDRRTVSLLLCWRGGPCVSPGMFEGRTVFLVSKCCLMFIQMGMGQEDCTSILVCGRRRPYLYSAVCVPLS